MINNVRSRIDPGRGYRLLKPTEIVDANDQVWIKEKSYWKFTAFPGVLAGYLQPVRRKIRGHEHEE